jgi:hypothetical protein
MAASMMSPRMRAASGYSSCDFMGALHACKRVLGLLLQGA